MKLRLYISVFTAFFVLNACGGSSTSKTVDTPEVTSNNAPTADAGPDQSISTGSHVTLDGSSSSDVDGDTINYSWVFTSAPVGSNAVIDNATTINPAFTADIDGTYVVELTVDDGQLTSTADSVTVNSTTAVVAELSYPIVDTNQSICYNSSTGAETNCSGAGHDADYAGNQPDYTLSSDGLTVTDNVTKLFWQQSNDINGDGLITYDDKLLLSDAITYCQDLSFSGRDDWRLPSIKESYSLILFSGKDPSSYEGTDTSSLTLFYDDIFQRAFGDPDVDPRIIDGQFASSTLYVSTTMNGNETMFGVNFVDGRIKGYPANNKQYYVRCVAGNTDYGINSFVDNADATITDQATGLMWQQNDAESTNWENAISQCEADTTAGFDDWRLPNVKELQSIVDYTRAPAPTDGSVGSAAINPIFNSTSITNEAGEVDWGFYWSSTTHVNHTGIGRNASYVSFGRALGNMSGTILDVHGAGAQRSNDKVDVSGSGASSDIGDNGILYYYKGPQGDIMRINNKFRCVRSNELAIQKDGSVNILLIVADDLGVDNVSGYEEQPNFTAQTPNIDDLVNEGVLFRNAWANPMCSPSRASLLTGRHAFRHGVTHPGGSTGQLANAEETIAEVLSLAGYKTALFGKWHLGRSSGRYPTDQGFDYYSGSLANIESYFNWQKTQITSQGGDAITTTETGYATDITASEALSWINNQTSPWFVKLAFNAPHDPYHVPPPSRYSNVTLTGIEGADCTLGNQTDAVTDCYRAAAEAMDTNIGELIAQLPAEELANTLIIFVGDNGTPKEAVISEAGYPFLSDHGKGTMYEGGVNVPLIIWAGSNVGLDKGEISDKIQISDLFSTIVELAGTTTSSGVEIDGKSLIGYLDLQTTSPADRNFLYSELLSVSEGIDRWAISNGSIKYINNESVEECYNLDTNPGETTDEYSGSNSTTTTCDSLRDNRPQ
ncbi:MAG: sulfatase-like hydrolase/transferase [Gammaproteobacteria bacterium]|nr:sulfatase-like hydrolase/transferase [Gammaproteobacteria bacterium]